MLIDQLAELNVVISEQRRAGDQYEQGCPQDRQADPGCPETLGKSNPQSVLHSEAANPLVTGKQPRLAASARRGQNSTPLCLRRIPF
jgi:hypothetical protein